jgi:hypothetical protein
MLKGFDVKCWFTDNAAYSGVFACEVTPLEGTAPF